MNEIQHIDPVCKMQVTPSSAKGHSLHNASDYYFCSASCKTKFDQNPENYIQSKPTTIEAGESILKKYKPLIVIFLVCILFALTQSMSESLVKTMRLFMGYFFVLFAMFKFFDLKGFVDGFSTYDLITKKIHAYGYVYPWIELALGTSFLLDFKPVQTNVATVIVMVVSGMGVLKSIFSGSKIKCACLGTTLNVPLTTVSVLENFGMAAMALYQLIV